MNGKITAIAAIAIALIWGLAQPSWARTDVRVHVKSYLNNHGYSNVVVTHRGRVWTRVRARYGSRLYHVRVNRHGRILRHRARRARWARRASSRVHYSGDYADVAVNGSQVRVDAPYTRVRGSNGRYWADSSDTMVRVNSHARSVRVYSHGVSVNIGW